MTVREPNELLHWIIFYFKKNSIRINFKIFICILKILEIYILPQWDFIEFFFIYNFFLKYLIY